VPTSSIIEEIAGSLIGDQSSLILFGSYARNDAGPHSDMDILQLVEGKGRSYRAGHTSVAVYSIATLKNMAVHGNLFVLHLLCEGIILKDLRNRFGDVLNSYRPPASYDPIKTALRLALPLLDTTESEYLKHRTSLKDLAFYLLRTSLYIEFAELGRPLFSLRAITEAKREAGLLRVLELKNTGAGSFDEFREVVAYLERNLGTECRNVHGTPEALVTNVEAVSAFAAQLGLRLLSGDRSRFFGYEFPWDTSNFE
jgi:hypothetical protein